MGTRESYHVPTEIDSLSTEPINLSRRLPDAFRDWPPSDMDDIEFEFLKALAKARAEGDASSIAYVEHVLSGIDTERDRQARIVRSEAGRRGRRAPGIRHDGRQLADLAVELKARVSLIDFVEATGAAIIGERSRDRLRIHCPHPLHPDAHPSCIVDRQRFHCFGCGADGDIFDLVNLVWGITSFRDRVRIVADFARQGVRS